MTHCRHYLIAADQAAEITYTHTCRQTHMQMHTQAHVSANMCVCNLRARVNEKVCVYSEQMSSRIFRLLSPAEETRFQQMKEENIDRYHKADRPDTITECVLIIPVSHKRTKPVHLYVEDL